MAEVDRAGATPLDSNWLRDNPLPEPEQGADKNARGRVLAIGGCTAVPGGLLLTAEGALRAGAGKVRVATVRGIAMHLGLAMPEIAAIGLDATDAGEIAHACEGLLGEFDRTDAVVAGPAMGCKDAAGAVVDHLLRAKDCTAGVVLDAAALMGLHSRAERVREREVPVVLTPHIGEMAAIIACDADAIEANRPAAVRRAAETFGAVVLLKGSTSLVADRDGRLFAFAGGGVGLATGGSGDVLAGIAAGLLARGADPLRATLWAVWLHGEAGRRCAERIGPIGFLSRELLALVPGLMRGV